MRKIILSIVMCTLLIGSCVVYASANYAIYPTQNYWTHIELDTRDGKMWQVHTSTSDDGFRGKLPLNLNPLTEYPEAGRFILSPTGNMYTFILLDTIDGQTWQVQWSISPTAVRGIVAKIE